MCHIGEGLVLLAALVDDTTPLDIKIITSKVLAEVEGSAHQGRCRVVSRSAAVFFNQ